MTTFLIEHGGEAGRSEEGESLVSRVVGAAASEKLQRGHHLLTAVPSDNRKHAEPFWEGPGRSEPEDPSDSMKPPTSHTLSAVRVVYGPERTPARAA